MAKMIPGQILDAALKEAGNFSDDEAQEIYRISIVQPALVEYLTAMMKDSSEGVQGFASGMFIAIHQVFEKQFGKLQKVGTQRVEQIADRNEQAMIYLRIRQPEIAFLPPAMASSGSQPSLLAYVFESIRTADE
jgi:hypothetical protein